MKEAFIDWRPQTHSEHRLNRAITLLEEHGPLTLKQVYNMLDLDVSQDSFGETLSNARLAGRLDWDLIIDGPSRLTGMTTAAGGTEVWIESEAMVPWVWNRTRQWLAPVAFLRSFPPIGLLYRAHKRNAAILHFSSRPELDLESLMSVFQPTTPPVRIETGMALESWNPDELADAITEELSARLGAPVVDNYQSEDESQESLTTQLNDDLIAGIRTAMKETGDTTRAASLKRKIEELLG